MNGPPKESLDLRNSAFEAIDRNRNTRQKTVLLSYVAVLTRERSVALRSERVQAASSPQDTCARVARVNAPAAELPEPGQKKPVQSIRTIPSV